MATTLAAGSKVGQPMTREEKKVIFASSLGTVFEWYDFYLYGTLAVIIDRRIQTLIASKITETRNGTRQPHSAKAASPISVRVPRITSSDRNRPIVAVVWIHEVNRPRLPCGECSAT